MSDLGPPYTVIEYGIRCGNVVESLGTHEEFRLWRSVKAAVFELRTAEPVQRTVTGRDYVFTKGLLAGGALKVKAKHSLHPGVPAHIDEATGWVPMEGGR